MGWMLMRYLVGATYLVVSCSLLPLLVDTDGGLALLLRAAVWMIATGAPLLCSLNAVSGSGRTPVRGMTTPVVEW